MKKCRKEVAPLAGSVDRNGGGGEHPRSPGPVAPLAGSVDRNYAYNGFVILTVVSLPSRGAWIEINWNANPCDFYPSLPSRGAWIEIRASDRLFPRPRVAPLAGSVDRNFAVCAPAARGRVAPLAGSVDRNPQPVYIDTEGGVAPLAGSVDRNGRRALEPSRLPGSLPSRGAWIEIRTAQLRSHTT